MTTETQADAPSGRARAWPRRRAGRSRAAPGGAAWASGRLAARRGRAVAAAHGHRRAVCGCGSTGCPRSTEIAARVRRAARHRPSTTWTSLQSLIRILTGFGLAAVAGVAVGMLVGPVPRWPRDCSAAARSWCGPIPAIALVPVAILLFPTDEQGIVFITFTAAFFPIMVSTRHAVRALPTLWEDAVRTLGGGRRHVLGTWCCPASCPACSAGCRSAWAWRGSA